MVANFIVKQLKDRFPGETNFSRKDLHNVYLEFEPGMQETTFRWRIYDLKAKKLIRSVSKNQFTLNYKPEFTPDLSSADLKVYAHLETGSKGLMKSLYSTSILNEFMLHQPAKFFLLVEVEKEAAESVFYYLKESNKGGVFLEPGEKELQRYVSDINHAIVVQPLISKAPLQKVKKATTATLEKILVDLYCDKNLFYAYQGSELSFIFNTAYQKYAIDFTRLLAYARRRNRERDLMHFLSEKTEIPQTTLND